MREEEERWIATRAREDREKREAPFTKRFTRLFAATNNLFMESALKPHRERQKEKTNDIERESERMGEEEKDG